MKQPNANTEELKDFLGLLSFMAVLVALAWVCL